jgi:hypothetical protein
MNIRNLILGSVCLSFLMFAQNCRLCAQTNDPRPLLNDPQPQRYKITARASEIDPNAKEHPEIDFLFSKEGKPQDTQVATVDTRVPSQGRLVLWLMPHNDALFERVNNYGIHAIQVHYANKWFGILCRPKPKDAQARGNIRLEAAIGEDVSDEIEIPKPDSIVERSRQFLVWLSKNHPQGKWDQFLTDDQSSVRWDKVTVAGSSHGSTTAARFAKHQSVDRVVMLCGPRDQDQDWQSLPSATSVNRYFGFSHVLDGGWTGNHYCRSWELLGLHELGETVDVDKTAAPFHNSRRLVSAANVDNDPNKAHGAVQPGKGSPKGADGQFLYEPVWDYLFNHPVDKVGSPSPRDPSCVVPQ